MSQRYVDAVSKLGLATLPRCLLTAMALRASEGGVVELSINEIGKACGYSVSSVYLGLRFLDKTGVLVLERHGHKPSEVRRYRLVIAVQREHHGEPAAALDIPPPESTEAKTENQITIEPWIPW